MSENFDTLDTTRQLQAAGMERPHAEAVADVVRDSRDGLATQVGLDALSSRIDTLRWMIGLLFVMNMAILGVMLAQAF